MCQTCRKNLRDLEIKFARLLVEVMNHNRTCDSGNEFNFKAVFVSKDGEVTPVKCMTVTAELHAIRHEISEGQTNVPH